MVVLMIEATLEFVRQMITLVLVIWNYRLFKQSDALIKLNFDLLERMPNYNIEEADDSIPRINIADEEVTTDITPVNLEYEYDAEVITESYSEDEIPLDIDFDEASRAWRQNKIHEGNGTFRYRHRIPSPEPRPRDVSASPIPQRRRRYNTRQAAREREERISRIASRYVAAG